MAGEDEPMRGVTSALLAMVIAMGCGTSYGAPRTLPQAAASTGEHRSLDGVFLRRGGAEDAPLLVLVHGLGDRASTDFDGIWEALGAEHRLLALDLPGFGQSQGIEHSYAPSDYAEDVAALIRRESPGAPVRLLGHSMGGAIAALVAGTHPELVSDLVLVDAAGVLHREAFAASQFIDPLRRNPSAAVPAGLMETTLAIGRAVEPEPATLLGSSLIREHALGNEPGTIAALSLIDTDLGAALAGISAPTLLVWGGDDRIAPLRNARALHSRIRGSHLQILEGVGHVPMNDAPERLAALVLGHFRGDAESEGAEGDARESARCDGESGVEYEGHFSEVVLDGCEGVVLRGSVQRLVMSSSSVTLEAVRVGGAVGVALRAADSVVRMDGGSVIGEVALQVSDSRLDLAGVRIEGGREPILVGEPTRALMSVVELRGPGGIQNLHGSAVLVPQ